MSKALVIAKREYLAMVRTKAFFITTVLMPILMFGAMFIQNVLRKHVNIENRKIAIIDPTGELFDDLAAAAEERNTGAFVVDADGNQVASKYVLESVEGPADEALLIELSDRVRDKTLDAFAVIPDNILDPQGSATELAYYTERAVTRGVPRWLGSTLDRVTAQHRLQSAGLDPEAVATALRKIRLNELTLLQTDESGTIVEAKKASREANIFVPIMVMMLMFMSIMITAQPMLQSVIEEKQMRIAEVLMGSASPFDLMMGKLLGNVGVSLTLVTVYFGVGYIIANEFGFAELMPMYIVGWFVAYQVLAVMLYSSIFMAIGAACSDLKDAQGFLMPIMILLASPMFVWFNVLQDPLSSFSQWSSLFPPATSMLMVLRLTVTQTIPLWQPLLGMLLVLITVVGCVFAAGRVFRIGILSQGKTPKVNELIRWIISG